MLRPKVRPAREEDQGAIRAIVRTAGINPLGLDWHRFLLALNEEGEIIGCGQVKQHGDGSRELASIAVKEEHRGRGIGTALVERLLELHPPPLYLTCRERLEPFYTRFGFEAVYDSESMPRYFRRVLRLFGILRRLRLTRENLLVMRWEGDD